ncbi:plasmid transfer protein TraA [Streptomyces halstedii]|uniref:plasmid transfer protein TraA n=1 Tax=Streptomyces halstedii TaxID=1944 RepID=UPI0038144ABF
MTTPANDSTSYSPGPRPVGEPAFPRSQQNRAANGRTDNRTINKSRTGGGFNPSLNLTVKGGGGQAHNAVGQQAAPAGPGGTGGKIPGSDFMSNEDIQAFCEHLRKEARNRATERAMDADHLEAVLRTIPDAGGSLHGARARARRVSRWLKKIAAAEKAIQKYSAMVYGTFEREYESDLRKVGKGRYQPPAAAKFGWR